MKLLLDAGANIDAQSVNGGTPLMRAIETSQKDIVKLLLERGYEFLGFLSHCRHTYIYLYIYTC